MDIVAILKEGFEVSKKNLVIFMPTVAVAIIMFVLLLVFLGGSVATIALRGGDPSAAAVGGMLGGMFIVAVAGMVLGFIAYAMTVAMADEAISKGSTSFDTGMEKAKASLVNVLIASILVGIVVGIGFMLLIIPGLVAIFFLIFTLPAIVLDNLGAVDGMKKSYEIVKANVGDIIVLIVVIFGLGVLLSIISWVLRFIPLLGQLVSMLLSGAFGGYLTVVIVRVYRQLTSPV
jgi:hypothetical protein